MELLTRKELMAKLKKSRSTIIKWEKKGMPFIKNSNCKEKFYSWDNIINWLMGKA